MTFRWISMLAEIRLKPVLQTLRQLGLFVRDSSVDPAVLMSLNVKDAFDRASKSR